MEVPFLAKNTHVLILLSEEFFMVIYVYGWLDLTRGHLMWRILCTWEWIQFLFRQWDPSSHSGDHFWVEGVMGGPSKWQNSLPLLSHWILLRRAVHFRHTWKCTSSGEKSKLTLSSNHVSRTVCIYSTDTNWAPWCASFCKHWRQNSVHSWLNGACQKDRFMFTS